LLSSHGRLLGLDTSVFDDLCRTFTLAQYEASELRLRHIHRLASVLGNPVAQTLPREHASDVLHKFVNQRRFIMPDFGLRFWYYGNGAAKFIRGRTVFPARAARAWRLLSRVRRHEKIGSLARLTLNSGYVQLNSWCWCRFILSPNKPLSFPRLVLNSTVFPPALSRFAFPRTAFQLRSRDADYSADSSDSSDSDSIRFFASESFRFSLSDLRRSSPCTGSESVVFSTLRTASVFSSRSATLAVSDRSLVKALSEPSRKKMSCQKTQPQKLRSDVA